MTHSQSQKYTPKTKQSKQTVVSSLFAARETGRNFASILQQNIRDAWFGTTMTMTMKNYYKCKDEHRQRAERNKLEDRDSCEETWTSVQFDRSMAMGQTTTSSS